LSFQVSIEPTPKSLFDAVDLEGNDVSTAWFDKPMDRLTISTAFEAETCDANPFHFLLCPSTTKLPLVGDAIESKHFALYAARQSPSAKVEELARDLANDARFSTIDFLCGLNEWIHAHHENILRPTGAPWPADHTLREGRGACRDLAVIFIEACRVLNIPSRFVSGYSVNVDQATDRELHAWAEVYLSGAGWRGFDPSLGLAITERHLVVAVGLTPEVAAPITGTFRGDAASVLEAEIEIETSDAHSV